MWSSAQNQQVCHSAAQEHSCLRGLMMPTAAAVAVAAAAATAAAFAGQNSATCSPRCLPDAVRLTGLLQSLQQGPPKGGFCWFVAAVVCRAGMAGHASPVPCALAAVVDADTAARPCRVGSSRGDHQCEQSITPSSEEEGYMVTTVFQTHRAADVMSMVM